MAMTARGASRSKKTPVAKRGGELSAYRWSVSFNDGDGTEISKRAERQGTKPAIWCREAALQRLARERAADGE
jgi:hypothetical protein